MSTEIETRFVSIKSYGRFSRNIISDESCFNYVLWTFFSNQDFGRDSFQLNFMDVFFEATIGTRFVSIKSYGIFLEATIGTRFVSIKSYAHFLEAERCVSIKYYRSFSRSRNWDEIRSN